MSWTATWGRWDYYAIGSEAISYPEEGNEACFQIEDQSFWFRHRNNCIQELVRKFPPNGKGPIFDVGGGNGFVAKGMMRSWRIGQLGMGCGGRWCLSIASRLGTCITCSCRRWRLGRSSSRG